MSKTCFQLAREEYVPNGTALHHRYPVTINALLDDSQPRYVDGVVELMRVLSLGQHQCFYGDIRLIPYCDGNVFAFGYDRDPNGYQIIIRPLCNIFNNAYADYPFDLDDSTNILHDIVEEWNILHKTRSFSNTWS